MKSYIISDPNILGGKLVIRGTRIPISRVIFLLKEGYTVDAIQQDFPYVKREVLDGAVSEVIEILDKEKGASQIL